mgnify:CR=1 FL=1
MRRNDIENWALDIIERVLSQQPVEDSRVELKSEWPNEPHKAARRIAGHANAARGEPILWLIGLDEKDARVTGANYTEISNWKQSIEACFNELAPTLTHLNVPYESKTVVALLWETDRRPFLVKNPEGGPISLEVPWRDAASTRTATRMDLLRLLYPVSKIPSFEIIKGYLKISTGEQDGMGGIFCRGGFSLDVYIVPGNTERVVIPYHKCEAKVKFISSELSFNLGNIWFQSSYEYIPIPFSSKPSHTIICTGTEAVINGPGMATITTSNPSISSENKDQVHGDINVMITILPIGADTPINIIKRMSPVETPEGALGHWVV